MCYGKNDFIDLKKGLLLFFFLFSLKSYSQINEPVSASVYQYLYRMAEKGFIKWNDYELPLDRTTIFSALEKLSYRQNSLTKTELKELKFYRQEYSFDADTTSNQKVFLKKDLSGRLRAFRFDNNSNRLFVDPIIGFEELTTNRGTTLQYFSGIRVAGYFGKKWGFNFAMRDNNEKGDSLTHKASFAPVEGIVPTITNQRLINYSSFNVNLTYKWKNGSLAVGQENFSWGYGLAGNIILSGRAPSFPFIKFDFTPWQWLHFNYLHGWLQSNIIDSLRSYNTGTGIYNGRREIYFSKFIAQHSIVISPNKNLDIGIGESIVYSDKLNFAYLIPVNFFKVYDAYNSRYNIRAGDNSQFFGFVSSRNFLKNTHLYAQIFIDEIRASKIFNKNESRNQLGYTFGINKTDLFIPYLTAGMEYSKINPFVYNNLIPAQTYESNTYSLGDWMGNNADRLYFFTQYVPLPKWRIKLWYEKIRKGDKGTLAQQYYQSPQPGFLFSKLFDYYNAGFSVNYELLNKLNLLARFNTTKFIYTDLSSVHQTGFRFGFTYGL